MTEDEFKTFLALASICKCTNGRHFNNTSTCIAWFDFESEEDATAFSEAVVTQKYAVDVISKTVFFTWDGTWTKKYELNYNV